MKKLLSFIFCFLSFTYIAEASTPVNEVFSDVDKNYKYYNELQVLYDKGIFAPDENGRFNPKKFLNRDEFVGILVEISCINCIYPNVDEDLLQRFGVSETFFDVKKENRYYYCIAYASNNSFVSGYNIGTKCEDGTLKENLAPFCPNNTITLEEALAVILRVSSILTNAEAESIRQQIARGEITQNLADDVSPKNPNGSVYSFYPDFFRALNYQLVEIDKNGNEKIYNLVQKSADNKLNPRQPITKEDFLYMAYVTLKANACIDKQNKRPLINDGNRNVSIDAKPSTGNAPLVVNFNAIVYPNDNNLSYSWDFGNGSFGIGKNTNHTYKEPGDYRVILTVTDKDGKKNEAEIIISVKNSNLSNQTEGEIGNLSGIGDFDSDGVNDLEDLCPTIPGPKENKGCPIFDDFCKQDSNCKLGFYCNSGVCSPKQTTIGCEYTGGDLIMGNVSCNSCPCKNNIEFFSTIRRCDIVFPAISSPDGSTIYKRGNYFEVK